MNSMHDHMDRFEDPPPLLLVRLLLQSESPIFWMKKIYFKTILTRVFRKTPKNQKWNSLCNFVRSQSDSPKIKNPEFTLFS